MAAAAGRPQITKPSRFIAAAKAGEDNLIEEYLNDRTKNIDVNKLDSLGQTALHWASASGYPTTCELLLSRGANPLIQDKSGETALHKAAWRGSAECVQVLLEHGADPDCKNNEGKTALDLCRVREVRRLLVPQIEVDEDEEADQEDPDSD